MVNADLAWAVEDVRARLPHYHLYRNYWAGRHRLTFATEKFLNAFGSLFQEFADNLCDDVVDEPTSRMKILSWSATDKDLSQAAQDLWEINRGGPRAKTVHRNGYREGDGFLIVWPDSKDVPRFYPQRPEQMAVAYDDDEPDTIRVAAKVWREGKRYRATLYYADHLERYATKGVGAEGGLPKAAAFEPLEWQDDDGVVHPPDEPNPWDRMPVFHFPADAISTYGRSVLDDVIPLQDALNKSVTDMLVGMEFHALPQRWATGITLERDPDTGQEVNPFKSGAERLWRSGNDKAAFGQFPNADLSQMLAVQGDLRMEIARKGCLPPFSVDLKMGGGRAPSGVSLLIMEGRAVKRVKDSQECWGITWREAMALALTMGGHGDVQAIDLDMDWGPVETRDEAALVTTLQGKVELGVSEHQALLELGYDEDKIDAMQDESAHEASAKFGAQQMMAGGRMTPIGPTQAQGLAGALGLPSAPPAPNGAGTPPLTTG